MNRPPYKIGQVWDFGYEIGRPKQVVVRWVDEESDSVEVFWFDKDGHICTHCMKRISADVLLRLHTYLWTCSKCGKMHEINVTDGEDIGNYFRATEHGPDACISCNPENKKE